MRTKKLFVAHAVCTALLTLVPAMAMAQAVVITPKAVTSSEPLEKALRENKGRASMKLEGQGGILKLTYQASEPLTIFMVPLSRDERFVQTDFILMALPKAEKGIVDIDLTVSTGWSPLATTWLLNVMTKDEEAIAGFAAAEFVPVSTVKTITTFFRHSVRVEAYTPSSYHGLRGYRALSLDLTMVAGIALFIVSAAAVMFAKKTKKLQTLVIVVVTFHALYGLRFGVDLLRFTGEHLIGYSKGHYDEAGSIYQVAEDITKLASGTKKEASVFVCRSGTDYKEKILRYFTYPVVVSSEVTAAATADFALGMDTDAWRYETVTDGDSTKQLLHCGTNKISVHKVSEFPDGSIIFTIRR